MIELIEKKIKELYGSKASFCAANDYKYKASASELKPHILRKQTIDVLGQNEMKVVFTKTHRWGWDTETKMFYLLMD